jgi:hypothetical protein
MTTAILIYMGIGVVFSGVVFVPVHSGAEGPLAKAIVILSGIVLWPLYLIAFIVAKIVLEGMRYLR